MNNAIINFPVPANEPVKAYLEGSPERVALDAELDRQWNTVLDIPIIIGGRKSAPATPARWFALTTISTSWPPSTR